MPVAVEVINQKFIVHIESLIPKDNIISLFELALHNCVFSTDSSKVQPWVFQCLLSSQTSKWITLKSCIWSHTLPMVKKICG